MVSQMYLARQDSMKQRGIMSACSFKKLVLLLDKKLDLDEKLEVLGHLQSCTIPLFMQPPVHCVYC